MRLSDRLTQQRERPSGTAAAAAKPADSAAPPPRNDAPPQPADPLAGLKRRIQEALYDQLGARLYDSSLTEDQLVSLVRAELGRIVDQDRAPLSSEERARLTEEVSNDVLGYGPLQALLADPDITEVMVNNLDGIYVERAGRLAQTDLRFVSEQHLRGVIERIVSEVGRRIDESSPMVDARLPDGSRVNAIIPPLAVRGPALTIRKFSADPLRADDLVAFGSLSQQTVNLLAACVRGKLNMLISGGTGTGKTTLLNVLSSFIPDDERIVTIEDAVELQLHQDNLVQLESRPANIEGKGAVPIRDLVRNALRMRPDRIVVGEVRGAEALDMLQAMNTGHEGSMSTVHANSPRDALARIETMVLMSGMELPVRAIREQVGSALDVIVQLARMPDGTRRITHVSEVQGMEGQVVTMADLFTLHYRQGKDGVSAELVPTGIRPQFSDRLAHQGLELPAELFMAGHDIIASDRRSRS